VNEIIPSNEIRFHPLSFQDEAGRLFKWRGELYRGLAGPSAPFLARFVESDAGRELVAAGLLIETEVTPYAAEGFDIVLRHRLLPFPSYPFEWCAAMFRAASLTIIDLAIGLARHDLMLKDAHPWNVIFDGCRPVWVDLTSIQPAHGSRLWPAETEFYDNCLHPLLLMAQGREKLARSIIAETEAVLRADLEMLGGSRSLLIDVTTALLSHVPEEKRKAVRKTLRPLRSVLGKKEGNAAPQIPLLQRLEQIRAEVENIRVPFGEPQASPHAFQPNEKWNAKERSLYQILTQKKPATVLDIASGSGWSSELAAQFQADVAAFDLDAEAVGRLLASARAHELSILPVVMDFTRPTPARGLANHAHLAATERFACEMVLMLGFLHDLVFRYRRLGLNEICDGLASFSKRWLVLEFIPGNDPEVGPLWSDWFAGYTLDNLKQALGRHFSRIEVLPSHPCARVLLLCER
jgi:SAM-dependent methyltransferase